MKLPEEEGYRLKDVIQADTSFLAAQSLLDYSMLVGVVLPTGQPALWVCAVGEMKRFVHGS